MKVCPSHEKAETLPRFLYLYDLVGVQRFVPGDPVAVMANCPKPGCASTVCFEAREEDL